MQYSTHTSSCSICFSLETRSYSCLRESYSCSSCFAFHRARRFWNQTAIWRGCKPRSLDSFSFPSESSLISPWKLCSSEANCPLVSLFFFVISFLLLGYRYALMIFSDSGTDITGPVCVTACVYEFPAVIQQKFFYIQKKLKIFESLEKCTTKVTNIHELWKQILILL